MHELITPLPNPHRHRMSSVDNDLHALQDQMHRCAANVGPHQHVPMLVLGVLRRFLHRYLVSLIVLLALLSAVVSVGASVGASA
jgi:hypothetical protein